MKGVDEGGWIGTVYVRAASNWTNLTYSSKEAPLGSSSKDKVCSSKPKNFQISDSIFTTSIAAPPIKLVAVPRST